MTNQTAMTLAWFEIPATDLERATAFYKRVFETPMMPMDSPGGKVMAFLDGERPYGCITGAGRPDGNGFKPYFGCADIEQTLGRVERAGGEVVMPKTSIGAFGHIAQFSDSEGNVIALHSA